MSTQNLNNIANFLGLVVAYIFNKHNQVEFIRATLETDIANLQRHLIYTFKRKNHIEQYQRAIAISDYEIDEYITNNCAVASDLITRICTEVDRELVKIEKRIQIEGICKEDVF